jgi:hypothetical protein
MRVARFGLRVSVAKTRLIRFSPPSGPRTGAGDRASFDFLGFKHYWRRSRKGQWTVGRKTARVRLSQSLKRVRAWCRKRMHAPVSWQHTQLSRKMRGHYAYYAIRGNYRSLDAFHRQVTRIWRTWLHRRSQKARRTGSVSTRSWIAIHFRAQGSTTPSDVSCESDSLGAGCGKPARPDLWGARAGDRPGLPDW